MVNICGGENIDDQIVRSALTAAVGGIVVEPIKHVINTWLKPKLEEMKKKGEIDEKLISYVFDVFSEYINRTYDYQKCVNIIALGLQQVEIDQVYIPLTIFSEEKREELIIDDFNLKFANKYKKIVIEDTAGMGKSTLMKKLFTSAVKQNIGIPVFIELRNLASDKDIIDTIVQNINSLSGIHTKDFILEVIQRGDFIFFLDGYDEIPFQYKKDVTLQIKQFVSKAGNNIFFLTSRFDDSLVSFGQFQKFEIEDLRQVESFQLFKKYDNITNLGIAPSIIKQIKENINEQKFSELESFLGNPLLVSFLYLTFKHKKDIPALKIDFYRKVYDALYELHDLSKDSFKRDKYSGLSCGNLQKVLMKLGFLCLRENVNDYNKDKLLKLIRNAKNSPYFKEIQEDDILSDLIETVPLMTRVGLDYKWSHKSFMEYFAAYFIDEQDNKEKILNDIYSSTNFSVYFNMLDFYYEINRQLFDKVFIYPIVKEFISFMNESGISPQKDTLKLEYFQVMFNRAVYFDRLYYKEPGKSKFEEVETQVKNRLSEEYTWIDNYTLNRTLIGSSFVGVFVRDKKIDLIIKLLSRKNNTLIKRLSPPPKRIEFKDEMLTIEELDIHEMNDSECLAKMMSLRTAFGSLKKGRFDRALLYIDYFESVKYRELIEEEIKIREEDIFLNL